MLSYIRSIPYQHISSTTFQHIFHLTLSCIILHYFAPLYLTSLTLPSLPQIIIERDVQGAIAYAKNTISDLLQNKMDISMLVITKSLVSCHVAHPHHTLSTHPSTHPSTHLIDTLYQHTLSIHPINTPYQPTLQHTLSIHPMNTSYRHTLNHYTLSHI